MNPALSLVIPAYNESARLPPFLQTARDYLAAVFGERYEIVVVDDGSADGMPGILVAAASDWPQLSVLRHAQNQGKGAAVRTGMLAARGELLLFADADGATPIEEEARLRAAIEAGADLAVGSRLIAGAHVAAERHWLRGLLGRVFASLARRCAGTVVRDTQCGFKMFRREVGRTLFSRVQERGYLLDVEVLLWAERLGFRIAEVPVNWTEQADSRLNMRRDGWKMFCGLWRLRRRTAQRASEEANSLPPAAS